MLLRLLTFIFLSTLLTFSLGSCADKPKPKKAKITQVSKAPKKGKGNKKDNKVVGKKGGKKTQKGSSSINYKKMQAALKLSTKQVADLKKIDQEYTSGVASLKKAKQWEGPKNAKKRSALKTKKVNSQKTALKKKFKAFQDYMKKQGKK